MVFFPSYNIFTLNAVGRIYLLAAILPAFVLMIYVYKKARREKEPLFLLIKLVVFGVLSAFLAYFIEIIINKILGVFTYSSKQSFVWINAMIGVALVEEGSKLLLLTKGAFNSKYFNNRFDGFVYAVFVSMGFAAYENIGYVFRFGLDVAISRAFLSVPAHMFFSIFMGFFFSRAKVASSKGHVFLCRICFVFALVSSTILHGLFDGYLMLNTADSNKSFYLLVALLYIVCFGILNIESKRDKAITQVLVY